jgi:hypothetical protein
VPVPVLVDQKGSPSPFPAPVVVDANGKPQVKLPCGAIVELAGISYHPSKGKPWWGIDGKAVAAPNFKFGGGGVSGGAQDIAREFAVKLIKKGPGRADLVCHVTPGGAMGYTFDGRVGSVQATMAANTPVSIRIGVPASAWRTIEEVPLDILPYRLKSLPGVIDSAEQSGNRVIITSSVQTRNVGSNMQFLLIGKDGQPRHWNGGMGSSNEKMPPWGLQETRWFVDDLQLEDVRSVRFETRNEEYAEFKNVPMEPK